MTRCDLCGELADTIHVVPYFGPAMRIELACPGHNPGGYWLPISEWLDEDEDWRSHIVATKPLGWQALTLIETRLAGAA